MSLRHVVCSCRLPSARIQVAEIFVCSGVTFYFFIFGLFFGAPTVFIQQIRRHANSTEAISTATSSWLVSISSYGSIPWAIICPIIARRYGRKIPYMVSWINTMICVFLFYFSSSVIELLICGFLQGMLLANQKTIAIMVFLEYTSPKYRGILITFKSATFFWGIWVSNAIGTFFHWKNIGVLIFTCCIYNVSVLFWPESPVWLATKSRFQECAKWHRWLKGTDKDSEDELQQLILSQKENLRIMRENLQYKQTYCCTRLLNSIKADKFYKPLLYAVLLSCLYHFSGKLVCTSYIIDIIKTISVSESAAYEGMLILDAVSVLGMYVGVYLTKLFKRRTLLLRLASLGAMFLYILSFYLYLVHLNVVTENKYFTLFLLMGFSISVCCGPMIMCMCFSGEMTPTNSRSLYLSVYALSNDVIMGIVLSLFPYIFKYFNSHGTFLFYAVVSSILIYILGKVLPETKDKTILEIEKCFSSDNKALENEIELINLKAACDKNVVIK